MTNDEEYELKFRDQCAIALLSGLVGTGKSAYDYYASHPEVIDQFAKMAYEYADAMRKVRLQSFT